MPEPHRPGRAALERALDAAEHALHRSAGLVLATAVDDAPLEDSDLRDSAHLEPEAGANRIGNRLVEVEVVFGTPYAAAQHEGTATMNRDGKTIEWHARHYTTPGTGPKFLENSLKEHAPRIESVVQAALDRAFHG